MTLPSPSNALPVLPKEIVERFRELQRVAADTDLPEPTAFILATADSRGRPATRTVLLKSFDEHGFVFYTNLESRKGRHLRENPRAAATFYWPPLSKQVQVEGDVERVTDAEADAYFATRARESQLGAWASLQSETLPSRWTLLRRVIEAGKRYFGAPVPRPPHWSGFRIRPDRIEFWQSSRFRLHDREEWCVEQGEWVHRRLYP